MGKLSDSSVAFNEEGAGLKAIYGALSDITAPPTGSSIDEIDYTWNADGTMATMVVKQGATTLYTLTFTWTSGYLTSIVRT